MHVPVEMQVWRLAVLALVGIGVDLVFHAYRAYRSVFRPRRFRYHLLDALVALITLAAAGTVVFLVNWGEVRLYVPISLACGFFVGNVLVGDLVYRFSRLAFQRLKRSLRWARLNLVEPPKRKAKQAAQWVKAKLTLPPEPPEEPPSEPPAEEGGGEPPHCQSSWQ